ILTFGYYLTVSATLDFNLEITTKTMVMIFALFMVFIWVPSIKNSVTFNETFMSAFKAFFTSLLFTLILTIGFSAILFAIDQLLFTISSEVYEHVLNIICFLFMPIFFLSLFPIYRGKGFILTKEQNEKVNEAIHCPKTLSVLLIYVIVPLT